MAFKLASRAFGGSAAIEYLLGTDEEAYTLGEALTLSSGKLTKASGEDIPLFICQKTQAAETTAATPIPVQRVMPNQEYETTFSTTPTSIVVGSIVTISSDGLEITATTADGVFQVSAMDGSDDGSVVRGHFRPLFARPGDIE